jgi:hypothetical protein
MILPLVVIALLAPVPQETPEKVGRTSRSYFAFEWSGLNEGGEPTTAVGVRFRLEKIDADPPIPARGVPIMLDMPGEGTYKVRVATVLKNLDAGIWEVTMRVMNDSGNFSAYTPPLNIEIVTKAPAVATGLRISEN